MKSLGSESVVCNLDHPHGREGHESLGQEEK